MVEVDMEETSKNFIAVPADPPALLLPTAVFAPPPPPPPPVTYIITFVMPLGRVHVPLEVKVCTELSPAANPDVVAPEPTATVSPLAPKVTVVPELGSIKFACIVLIFYYYLYDHPG
jgi:hypothetical protein